MAFGSIKRRTSDSLYSKYLRKLRKYTCERCGHVYQEGDGLWGLHVSHFYGRARESVRFDEENTDLLCRGCHGFFTSYPLEYVEWKKKQLGDKRFKLLTIRANTPGKRDDKLTALGLKQLLKGLD